MSFTEILVEKHVDFLNSLDKFSEGLEYFLTDHIRLAGTYWCVGSIAALGKTEILEMRKQEVLKFVLDCYDENSGGFANNLNHDPHVTSTHYALLIFIIYDVLDEYITPERRDKICQYVKSLQRSDGAVKGDKWGEVDARFAYNALAIVTLLNRADALNVSFLTKWIMRCQNYDGAFGPVPGAESHAAYTFCAIMALALIPNGINEKLEHFSKSDKSFSFLFVYNFCL